MNRDELLEALTKMVEASQTIIRALHEEAETRKAMGDVDNGAPGTEKPNR